MEIIIGVRIESKNKKNVLASDATEEVISLS